jgi:hypothetical protein
MAPPERLSKPTVLPQRTPPGKRVPTAKRTEDAEQAYRKAVAVHEKLVVQSPSAEYVRRLSRCYQLLAGSMKRTEKAGMRRRPVAGRLSSTKSSQRATQPWLSVKKRSRDFPSNSGSGTRPLTRTPKPSSSNPPAPRQTTTPRGYWQPARSRSFATPAEPSRWPKKRLSSMRRRALFGIRWGQPGIVAETGNPPSPPWRSRGSCAKAATASIGSSSPWPAGSLERSKKPAPGSTGP